MVRFCPLGAAVAFVLLLSGCFGCRHPLFYSHDSVAEDFPVLLRPDGSRVTAAEFRALVPSYGYILAAEEHSNFCHHQAQAALLAEARAAWRDAAERGVAHVGPPLGEPVLGLEMLPAEKNEFLAGLDATPGSRSGLDRNTTWNALWAENWGYSFDLYRPVFAAADAGPDGGALPVRGLNLPRRVAQAVMRGGLDALEPEDRALLPLDMPPMPPEQIEILAPYKAEHAQRMDEVAHKVGRPENQERVAVLPRHNATDFRAFPPGGPAAVDGANRANRGLPAVSDAPTGGDAPQPIFGQGGNFEMVMRLWDNGMGQRAAQVSHEMERPLFILAGSGHASLLWGVPRAIRYYDATAYVLTIMPVPGIVSESEARTGLLPVQEVKDPARDDIRDQLFLVCPPPARLGFTLRSGPGGLTVNGLRPDGPAARAGLREGDRLLTADGHPAREVRDVHEAAMNAVGRGEALRLEVDRNGNAVTLTLPLPRPFTGASIPGAAPAGPERP